MSLQIAQWAVLIALASSLLPLPFFSSRRLFKALAFALLGASGLAALAAGGLALFSAERPPRYCRSVSPGCIATCSSIPFRAFSC